MGPSKLLTFRGSCAVQTLLCNEQYSYSHPSAYLIFIPPFQAKRALEKGATAVIFDVSKHPGATTVVSGGICQLVIVVTMMLTTILSYAYMHLVLKVSDYN